MGEFFSRIEVWLSSLVAIIGLIGTTVTFLLKFVRNAKAKKALEKVKSITEIVTPYIEQAETFLNFKGAEKKAYVLNLSCQSAQDQKLPFDVAIAEKVIDEIVAQSKRINARDKDKSIT